VSESETQKPPSDKHRIRNSALGWAAVALAFYVGIIALLIFRSHH
jgi:hypothetical protein